MSEESKENAADQAVAKLVERTLDGVDEVAEFSREQIPEVVDQLLTLHLVESIGILVMCAAFILFFTIIPVKSALNVRRTGEDAILFEKRGGIEPTAGGIAFMVPGAFVVVFSVVGFMSSASDILQIWLAPKLYLLEYGYSLLK